MSPTRTQAFVVNASAWSPTLSTTRAGPVLATMCRQADATDLTRQLVDPRRPHSRPPLPPAIDTDLLEAPGAEPLLGRVARSGSLRSSGSRRMAVGAGRSAPSGSAYALTSPSVSKLHGSTVSGCARYVAARRVAARECATVSVDDGRGGDRRRVIGLRTGGERGPGRDHDNRDDDDRREGQAAARGTAAALVAPVLSGAPAAVAAEPSEAARSPLCGHDGVRTR